jgi:hypothetical protein
MNKKEKDNQLKLFLGEELRGNLQILIDPKKKDSFSDARIQTWVKTVSDRIVYHLNNFVDEES